jgi:hypothetical protein
MLRRVVKGVNCYAGKARQTVGRDEHVPQYALCHCLYYGLGEGTIARIDAGECMRSKTEARARELEGLGHQ